MQIEKRNIVKCVILSLITCGIYGIIWTIKLAREAVSVKDENDDGTLEIVLMLFLPFLGFYFAEKKLTEGCQAKGIPHKDNSILYLILGICALSIVDFCMLQNDLNEIADLNYVAPADNFYGAPQQPQYGAPQYGAPQQPQYGAPQYGAPQQPQYGAPQYGAPQQPQYEAPQQPPYQAPQENQFNDFNQGNSDQQ